jgi:prepilin-type N-terminal cleavage/methylation domain-containing protein/prepilin-type processing-associated H-X9-DG protein
MRRPSRCKGGFTLIELLIVISIITILLGILLPALQRVRASAQAAESLSNLSQIMSATNDYALDHDQMLPGGGAITRKVEGNGQYSSPPPAPGAPVWSWATKHGLLSSGGYINNYEFWLDPADGQVRPPGQVSPVTSADEHNNGTYTFSYTMMSHLGDKATGSGNIDPWPMTSFKRPSETLAYGEEYTGHLPADQVKAPINDIGFANVDKFEPRHMGRSQASFLDGSAKAVPAGIEPMGADSDKWNRWHWGD